MEGQSKKQEVATMFDQIAHKYDFLNRFLSGGIDIYWRKKTIAQIKLDKSAETKILDLATGTGDLAIEMLQLYPNASITGVDLSPLMIEKGNQKIANKQFQDRIKLLTGDGENLAFAENTFDAVMIAFGVRNFEHLEKGLSEMLRVLKPQHSCFILEFSHPDSFPIKQLYNFYFKNILPLIGKFISKDPKAYTYLFESVQQFPNKERFIAILEKTGFRDCHFKSLSFGICTVYIGKK